MNNGWSGSFFSLGRDVRQGSLLLPHLFILFVEVLAIAVRGGNEIKGLSVGNIECKLSQYADDTTMILDGSQASLERSFVSVNCLACEWTVEKPKFSGYDQREAKIKLCAQKKNLK